MATAETRQQLLTAIAACEEKKGEDTRVLELDPADSGLADFFLITSAANDRQVVAIADEIELRLKREYGLYPASVEGRRQGEWILLDYVDIVIHVFLAEKRAFYDIERLRKSARHMTGAEAEAELRSALAKRTLAVRTGSSVGKRKAIESGKGEQNVAAKAAKKAVKKAAKKAPVKAAARKAVKKAAKPAAVKKAPLKAAVKKTAAKKAVVKKAPLKSPAKKLPGKTKPPAPAAKKSPPPAPPVASPADQGQQPVAPPPPPPPPPPPSGPVKPPVTKED